MRIRSGFILHDIAGTWVVIPMAQRVIELNELMALSESAVLLWRKMETGSDMEELVAVLMKEYDIDEPTARMDVLEFILAVHEKGLIEVEHWEVGMV